MRHMFTASCSSILHSFLPHLNLRQYIRKLFRFFNVHVNDLYSHYSIDRICITQFIFPTLSVAFCPREQTSLTRGEYTWPETEADQNVRFPCAYKGINGVKDPVIVRSCNERGIWQDPIINHCRTFVASTLINLTNVS